VRQTSAGVRTVSAFQLPVADRRPGQSWIASDQDKLRLASVPDTGIPDGNAIPVASVCHLAPPACTNRPLWLATMHHRLAAGADMLASRAATTRARRAVEHTIVTGSGNRLPSRSSSSLLDSPERLPQRTAAPQMRRAPRTWQIPAFGDTAYGRPGGINLPVT
jgi:hypothetical protein